MARGTPIVVDGANIAHEHESKAGKPELSNIVAVRAALKEKGFDPIVIVDASLRHRIDDPEQLEKLIDNQTVLQVPAGTDADYFIIKTAEELGAQIVTNDRYKDRQQDFPWVEQRRVPVMIVEGRVVLYEENLEASNG